MANGKALLRQHRRAHREHIRRAEHDQENNRWRSAKSLDPIAFNGGAEQHFITWLTDQLLKAKNNALPLLWTFSNAAYELDVSPATVKRYVLKFTADRAPFATDGKTVSLRALKTQPRPAEPAPRYRK